MVSSICMDRIIKKEELETAKEIIRMAIRQLEVILDNVENEAKSDYDGILTFSDRLSLRVVRLWHKYIFDKKEEKS